jgi:hypothetical protein
MEIRQKYWNHQTLYKILGLSLAACGPHRIVSGNSLLGLWEVLGTGFVQSLL